MARDRYTCRFSPTWRGPGTVADCYALTGDETRDADVIAFCEASGAANDDEDNDRGGWPREGNEVDCPKWKAWNGVPDGS